MLLRASVLILFIFYSAPARAQKFFGISTGEGAQFATIFQNPATIGGCREKWIITLAAGSLLVDNNLGTISSAGKIAGLLKKNSTAKVSDVFSYSGHTQFSMSAPIVEFTGPGVIFAVNDQHSLAFSTRVRFFNQFYNFSKLLFSIGTKAPAQASVSANVKNFKWVANAWSEAGFSYGGILTKSSKNQLKIGVTVKLLGGVGYLGMSGKNLDLKATPGVDSFPATNANIEFSSSLTDANNAFTAMNLMSNIFGDAGSGYATDAGLVFCELLPGSADDDHGSVLGYKYAIALAITDVGAITYRTIINTTIKGYGVISTTGLSNAIKSYSGLRDYVADRGYTTVISNKADIVYRPTTFTGSLDYQLYKRLYADLILVAIMANDGHFGSRYYNQATLLPHYDSKYASVGLPVTYNTLTKNLRFGFGLHVRTFFFGSDDAVMLFKGGQYGFNLYFGGAIPIRSKKQKGL